jgi:hypothetical protein
MILYFCGKRMAWGSSKIITIKYFTNESRLYNLIMCFNLLRLSYKFLYVFMKKISINLSSVLCKSLIEMHECEDKMIHLIYPCLITRLLTHLKITIPSNILQFPLSAKPISNHSIKWMSIKRMCS